MSSHPTSASKGPRLRRPSLLTMSDTMAAMGTQPKPKVALENECAAVYNNTLYTYQASAFQSLVLNSGAAWESLEQGEAVSGAACVTVDASAASPAALWIVGGSGGSTNYTGLQRYTYSTGKWETITPVTTVTKSRINHSAVYLPGSSAIAVYAGSQDGDTGMSTQTFAINTTEPYSVLAYESDGAPPANQPIMLRWSDTEAVMVGGSSTNTQIMLFEAETGWTNSGATLASPLKVGTNGWHATLVSGADGSKSLYTYDMTVAPNVANRTLIVDAHGAPVSNAVAIQRRSDEENRAERRDSATLTATDWPSYNNTYASTAIRTSSAAAEDSDGKVILSGGNMDDVICIFDQTSNSWVNATALLVDSSDQKTLHASLSSSSTTATATATSTSATGTTTGTAAAESTTAAVAASTSSGSSSSSSSGLGTGQVIGVVFGSVGGIIVLMMLLYCQIKNRKRKVDFIQAGHARRASGTSAHPEKDGMAMATDSFPRSPTNPTFMRGHQPKGSTASFSSMAILMGKTPKEPAEGGLGPSFGRPDANTNKQFRSQIANPMPAIAGPKPPLPALTPGSRDERGMSFGADSLQPHPGLRVPTAEQDGLRRSSGWNQYWSGGSGALNILGYGNNPANRTTVASEGSHYSVQDTGLAPAVDPRSDPRNRRTQDSATVPPLQPLSLDGRPRFNRVNSGSPTLSTYPSGVKGMAGRISDRPPSQESNLSGYSSGIPPSVQESWDPTGLNSRPWTGQRATSSMYSSAQFPVPPSPGEYPPMPRNNYQSGVSQQPQLDIAHKSDMSWLNLGQQQGRI